MVTYVDHNSIHSDEKQHIIVNISVEYEALEVKLSKSEASDVHYSLPSTCVSLLPMF